jgi:hypothetical protein
LLPRIQPQQAVEGKAGSNEETARRRTLSNLRSDLKTDGVDIERLPTNRILADARVVANAGV